MPPAERRHPMEKASIKGVAFQSVAEDIHRLRKEKRIPDEVLHNFLKADDLAHLDEMVVPSLWYPIGVYGRCLELLCQVEANGEPDYLISRGVKAAERM